MGCCAPFPFQNNYTLIYDFGTQGLTRVLDGVFVPAGAAAPVTIAADVFGSLLMCRFAFLQQNP